MRPGENSFEVMPRKTIARKSIRLTGNQAREFFAAILPDDRLKEELNNQALAPEMRDAIVSEASKRDLIPGNYQI